jgi:hypothetical protein
MQGWSWPPSIQDNRWPCGLPRLEPRGCRVGNWGIGREVVPIGAGISNACVMSWKRRGGIWNNSVARAHFFFYTNENHHNKPYLPSHAVRCKCSNSCWLCCHPSCWQQPHCPCDPWLCCRKSCLCDAGCINGHVSNSSCLGKVCWWTTLA